jgi:hypothetical protein
MLLSATVYPPPAASAQAPITTPFPPQGKPSGLGGDGTLGTAWLIQNRNDDLNTAQRALYQIVVPRIVFVRS